MGMFDEALVLELGAPKPPFYYTKRDV